VSEFGKVRVYVFEGLRDYPANAIEFSNWLLTYIESIPKGYRDSAQFKISTVDGYDGYTSELELYYYRPETEIDKLSRLNKEIESRNARVLWLENQLRELKNS
jgi:hypothetical protein